MSKEAIDRLREKAQNEQTCIALSNLLKATESERDKLQADYNKAMADVAMLRKELGNAIELADALVESMDYLGTGSNSKAANKEQQEDREEVQRLKDIIAATADSEAWLEADLKVARGQYEGALLIIKQLEAELKAEKKYSSSFMPDFSSLSDKDKKSQ